MQLVRIQDDVVQTPAWTLTHPEKPSITLLGLFHFGLPSYYEAAHKLIPPMEGTWLGCEGIRPAKATKAEEALNDARNVTTSLEAAKAAAAGLVGQPEYFAPKHGEWVDVDFTEVVGKKKKLSWLAKLSLAASKKATERVIEDTLNNPKKYWPETVAMLEKFAEEYRDASDLPFNALMHKRHRLMTDRATEVLNAGLKVQISYGVFHLSHFRGFFEDREYKLADEKWLDAVDLSLLRE